MSKRDTVEMGVGKIVYISSDNVANNPKVDANMFNSRDTVMSDKDKEPSDIYTVENPTSSLETLLHIFKGNVGSGLLAMGDAFKNGGLIFGTILTAVLGVITVHAQHILLNCSEDLHTTLKLSGPPKFAETVELSFKHGAPRFRPLARFMGFLVNTFLCITQLGFCCVYIVFIGTNVQTILLEYGIKAELPILMAYTLVPVLLECCVRSLKSLMPLSGIANACMCVGVAIVLYEASHDLPSPTTRNYIADWKQLPLFFGTTVYAFEGIGLVLPLKTEMKRPEQFQRPCGVLNVGMVVVAILYIVVGFLGYLKWGDDVAGSLTLNMPRGEILSQVVQVMIVVGILFSYPLQFYVPVDIIWPNLERRFPKFKSSVAPLIVFRLLLALITFVLAESIPQLGLFISLVGAISSTALALVFPPLIELVLHAGTSRVTAFVAIKNVLIVLMGLGIFVTGTYESLASIVEAFQLEQSGFLNVTSAHP